MRVPTTTCARRPRGENTDTRRARDHATDAEAAGADRGAAHAAGTHDRTDEPFSSFRDDPFWFSLLTRTAPA